MLSGFSSCWAACLTLLLAACGSDEPKQQADAPPEKPRRAAPVDPRVEFCGERWPIDTYNVACSSTAVTNLDALASFSKLSMITLEGAKLSEC